jgi:hypothetical protein
VILVQGDERMDKTVSPRTRFGTVSNAVPLMRDQQQLRRKPKGFRGAKR